MAHRHACTLYAHAYAWQPLGYARLPPWQVEATKGALWDAFAEVAIYMEVLHVQAGTASRDLFSGKHRVPAWCCNLFSAAADGPAPAARITAAEQVVHLLETLQKPVRDSMCQLCGCWR